MAVKGDSKSGTETATVYARVQALGHPGSRSGKPVAQVARESGVYPTQVGKWRQLHRQYAGAAFAGSGRAYQDKAKVAELERMVGQLTMAVLSPAAAI